jgi:hypothetical protein
LNVFDFFHNFYVFIHYAPKIYSFQSSCVCDYLSTSPVCSIPLIIFCNAGFVNMDMSLDTNYFRLCSSWKVFNSPWSLRTTLLSSNFGWQLFSFRAFPCFPGF